VSIGRKSNSGRRSIAFGAVGPRFEEATNMATTERSDPAWIAHEINAVILRLTEKLGLSAPHLKSTLKKIATDWLEAAPKTGCPQDAYLEACATQAALASLLYPAIDGALKKGEESDPRVLLVRAVCNDVPHANDWSNLQEELWKRLDKPDLPADTAEEVALKLEIFESSRPLADPLGGGLIALRPRPEGPWPVYYVDARECRRVADDLVEWLGASVDKLS
jgi:hypothetical protein